MHALRLLALGIIFLLLLGRIASMEQKDNGNITFKYRTALGNRRRHRISGSRWSRSVNRYRIGK